MRLSFPLWHVSGLDNYSIPKPMLVKKGDYAKAHGIDPKTVVSHATTGSGPSGTGSGSGEGCVPGRLQHAGAGAGPVSARH